MPIKIRHFKNVKRGTNFTYATVPIEISSDQHRELENFLKENFGKNINYMPLFQAMNKWMGSGDPVLPKGKDRLVILYEMPEDKDNTWKEKYFLIVKNVGKKYLITPAPVVHNVMGYRHKGDPSVTASDIRVKEGLTQFDDLQNILEKGFSSNPEKNVENAWVKAGKNHRLNYDAPGGRNMALKNEGITKGDVFSIEVYPRKGFLKGEFGAKQGVMSMYRLLEASPQDITSVNVQLSATASSQEREDKMRFYQSNIADKYRLPVRFFEVYEDSSGKLIFKRVLPKRKSLEQHLSAIIGILGLLGSIFVSLNITGNVIGTQAISNGIGAILLVIGLVAGFFWFKSRKK